MFDIAVAFVSGLLGRIAGRHRFNGLALLGALVLLAAAAAVVRGVASFYFACHAAALFVLGTARHYVATHPARHRPDTFEDSLRAERRARQMTTWARVTISFSLLLMSHQLLFVGPTWQWNALDIATALSLAVAAAIADVCALTNQRAIADRLLVALRLRNVAETTARRTPARHALVNSEGVAQQPFAVALTSLLVGAAVLGLLVSAVGVEQRTASTLRRQLFGSTRATPPPSAAPASVAPSAAPAPTVTASPTPPSAQDLCGDGYEQTIRSDAPPTVSVALVDAFNRAGATVIGCPLARSRRVGDVWIVEAGTSGRRRGLVVASLGGVAHAVPAPRDHGVLAAALAAPRLQSVGAVRSTGSGDFQINFFADNTCSLTLRRVFRDPVTVVEPAAARALMSVAVARYQFPYVVEKPVAPDTVVYEVKFEYSSTSAKIIYDRRARRVVNAAQLGVAPSGPCANEEAFERLAAEFKRRYDASLKASRSRAMRP